MLRLEENPLTGSWVTARGQTQADKYSQTNGRIFTTFRHKLAKNESHLVVPMDGMKCSTAIWEDYELGGVRLELNLTLYSNE
jgi:hypothetical protein